MCDNKENQEENNKIYLDSLPKKGSKQIDWKKAKGYTVKCFYNGIEFTVDILDYEKNKKSHLTIKYKNEEYEIHHSSFSKCVLACLFKKRISTRSIEFKYEINFRIKDSQKDIVIIDREYKNEKGRKRKYYKYFCNICNKENGWIREDLIETNKLVCKHGKYTHSVKDKNNDIPTTAPWMIKYFQGGYNEAKFYTSKSNKKIYPICPDCGKVKNKEIMVSSIFKYHSIGCNCGDGISFPNKIAFNLLEQLNVYFQTEYSPDWIKPKRYDNYFVYKGKEYILEMDGGFHYNYNNLSGQTAEESQAIDNYKDEQAKLYGIEVIRIDCFYESNYRFEYIKNNILNNNKLNELFDLHKIDWNKVELYGNSNLVKLCCNYRKNNPNLEIEDIGKILKINILTIKKWLNKGKEFNWY